jgi:phage regulator Rha-like protein
VGKQRLIPAERIERSILLIRGQKVILDSDLAALYGVSTKRLNEQVRRNTRRFPGDFMFQLTADEAESLRSQFATSKTGRGGRRYQPYAFTEQGVAMLSTVLNSERAIDVNIAIMRAFVRLREILATHKELAAKLAELEHKLGGHDEKFQIVFEAIRQLMTPPPAPKKRRIGFFPADDESARPSSPGQARRKRTASPEGA